MSMKCITTLTTATQKEMSSVSVFGPTDFVITKHYMKLLKLPLRIIFKAIKNVKFSKLKIKFDIKLTFCTEETNSAFS